MALLWLESFDYMAQYPTLTDLNLQNVMQHRYAIANTTDVSPDARSVPGAHGGTAIKFGGGLSGTQNLQTKPLRDSTVDEVCIVGMRLYIGSNSELKTGYCLSIMSGSRIEFSLRQSATGSLSLYRSNNVFLDITDPIFSVNMGWVYFEVKVRIHDTLGSVEIKLDGTQVYTISNVDTRVSSSNYWDGISIAPGSIADNTIMDDFYVCDGSGTINNDFLGDTVVQAINPSSDGDTTTWTPSAGTNHSALVDDGQNMTDALSETDYITGDTSGEKDLFQYENLASPGLSTATTIHGVQVVNYCYLTEAQPADMKVLAKQNGTEGSVTETLRYDDSAAIYSLQTVFETNPDTAIKWTPTQVNGAQFGVEIV